MKKFLKQEKILLLLTIQSFLFTIGNSSGTAPVNDSIVSHDDFLRQRNIFTRGLSESLSKGKVVSNAEVKSYKESKEQSLDFYVVGIHQRDCNTLTRKTSQYEEFKNYFAFVSESKYDEVNKRVFLKIDSKLLPAAMVLDLSIPRVSAPGEYPFSFEKGYFKGLLGKVIVMKYRDKCLAYAEGKWRGSDTGLGSTIIEIFTETVMKIGLEKFFRLGST